MVSKQISTQTWIRTFALIFALINQVLASFSLDPIPFTEEQVYEYFSVTLTVVVTIWTYWKNNSWTKPAIEGDKVKEQLKAEQALK
jgi:SPP1 family holin